MVKFQRFLNDLELRKINLVGRNYSWSNKLLHAHQQGLARQITTLMLKVDTAKAFGSVSWPFLL